MKIAHIEQLPDKSFLIRVGPEDWKFGQPYEISLVAIDLGNKECEIKGLDKTLTTEHWRAICTSLIKEGFKVAVFDRIKLDGSKRKRINMG